MTIAAAMGYQAFVVKDTVTVTTTLNLLVPWYVAQTTAPGVTEMTVVCSQVRWKNWLSSLKCVFVCFSAIPSCLHCFEVVSLCIYCVWGCLLGWISNLGGSIKNFTPIISNALHIPALYYGSKCHCCQRDTGKYARPDSARVIQSSPLLRSAFCPVKIDHINGLTLYPGY